MKKWLGSAPSNIALIKYMGKNNHDLNHASNPSLSYTLESLRTYIEIEQLDAENPKDTWQPLAISDLSEIHLSVKAQERFLAHAARIKQYFNYTGNFKISSANNFPQDCGLASSASSFAALTKVLAAAICELQGREPLTSYELANLSQKGSGSSCRSFFSPWCVWNEQEIYPIDLPFNKLIHQVIIVEDQIKDVSSSEAHKRVATSSLFSTRSERVIQRFNELLSAFKSQDWQQICEITWIEFWDMHSLFFTAKPPFQYITTSTYSILETIRNIWQIEKTGPLVTLDAGPNVHLLYLPSQQALADEIKVYFSERFKILES